MQNTQKKPVFGFSLHRIHKTDTKKLFKIYSSIKFKQFLFLFDAFETISQLTIINFVTILSRASGVEERTK